MKSFIYFVCFSISFCVFSQEIPVIKVGEENIEVKKLYINTDVVGDIAITTFDMHFYNPNNRVLEGELSFPLGEGQYVTRFALEINKNLRDAVVIEKEKARIAYETTIRNKIDPALLEQTKGNNYKARIYPIPAKGYKRVVLAFQQKLKTYNDAYYHYKLPFNFKNKLEDFIYEIKISNQKAKPIFKEGMITDFEYDSETNSYYAIINKKKQKVIEPILIEIPIHHKKEKLIVSDDFFYFTKKLNVKKRKVPLEKKVTIFWDASLSQKDKKTNSELELLTYYFNKVKRCKVNLVVFNTKIKSEEKYSIKNGNWQLLKSRLENVVYDGASSFNFLSKYKSRSKINLLFTDGLNTLSNLDVHLTKKTFVINSSAFANHLDLNNIATASGGSYLNLNNTSIKKAFLKFTEEQLQFLGSNLSKKDIEIYPKKRTFVNEDFSISGKGDFAHKKMKLKFGYGNKVLKKVRFKLNESSLTNTIVAKIWAQKKLEYLLKNKKENANKIVALSKKHQVISPFTSMLILDRIQDYVTHKITPPEELKEQYEVLIAKEVDNRKDRFNRLQENLFNSYTSFFDWHAINFDEKKDTIIPVESTLIRAESEVTVNDEQPEVEATVINTKEINESESKEVKIDKDKVVVKNYWISGNEYNEWLDEVVVVGYMAMKKSHLTGSISQVSAEYLEQTPYLRIDDALQGTINNSGKRDIDLKGWNPDTPYLTKLKKESTIPKAYQKYLELRKYYGKSPSFYIDVADFFKKRREVEIAIQVLTNVAEIELGNYELLKALAYKFEEYKLYDYAVYAYKEILKLRPEDVQSHRDLALVYENVGEYQKSTDLLYQIVNGEFLMKDENRRFSGVEIIALNEFNRMLQLYKTKLKTHHFDEKFIKQTNTDFRVVIDWNHNDTDIDLWIIDPNKEKCYYNNEETAIGGLMSDDMTEGFGPEQFVLKKAIKGVYKIKAEYYSDSQQKISGPTFLKVSVFKNYGKKREKKTTQLIRLEAEDDVLDIGDVTF